MKKFSEYLHLFYENLSPLFKIFIFLFTIIFLISGFIFFTIEIDKSNLSIIKYCPSCGKDLLNIH